jgi:hypothetical protein
MVAAKNAANPIKNRQPEKWIQPKSTARRRKILMSGRRPGSIMTGKTAHYAVMKAVSV